MPIYEYECPGCGNRFETLFSTPAPSEQPCPECGQTSPKVMSATGGVVVSGRRPPGVWRRGDCDRTQPCCGQPHRCDKSPGNAGN